MKIHIREHEAPEMFFSMLNFGTCSDIPGMIKIVFA